MNDVNPYAPPAVDVDSLRPESAEGFWRDGDMLVVPRTNGTVLPDRCVHCNEPASGFKLKQTVYWHHQAIYLLVLISAIIYVVVALIVRKSVKLELGLCERHRSRRRLGFVLLWGGIAALLVSLFLIESLGSGVVLIAAFLFLGGLIAGIVMVRVTQAKRMDASHAWLKVGEPFLASIAAPPRALRARA
jgi:hypothetical protein